MYNAFLFGDILKPIAIFITTVWYENDMTI